MEQSAVQLVPPTLEKLGPFLEPDSPGDSNGASTVHSGSIIEDDQGGLRIYYTGFAADSTRWVCFAESKYGFKWSKPRLGQMRVGGEDSNRVRIHGLPEHAEVVQPIVFRLGDAHWRMYFWMYTRQPVRARYLVAEGKDGIRWRVLNLDRPCLRHPSDIGPWAWLEGAEARRQSGALPLEDYLQSRRLRSNDATLVYRTSQGYEMYSVWLLPNPPAGGRRVAYDNINNWLRVMHHRTSDDGLVWSDPQLVAVPDDLDARDQQFYYLSQQQHESWRVGFLGHYRVAAQTMDAEFTYSRDGLQWHRPLRGPWLPRGPQGSPDSTMVYMPGPFLEKGDDWVALYTAAKFTHGREAKAGKFSVLGLRIPKRRLAGLRSSDQLTARICTQPFIPHVPRLLLDADIQGTLRSELCDAFGRPLPGFTLADSVPLTGDSASHELHWKNAAISDYQYEGVSLRLEWLRGTVYGLLAG